MIGAGFGVLLLLMTGADWHGAVQGRKNHGMEMLPEAVPSDRELRVVLGCICGILLIYVIHGVGAPLWKAR